MQALLRAPRAPLLFTAMAFAGLAIFILAVAVLMAPATAVVGMERTAELVCLQLAFTPERAAAVVLSFPEEARLGIAQLLLPGDFTLAWGYGLVLAGLTGLLAMRLPGKWMQAGALFMWAPLLASLLDCIENMFLYAIVQQLIASPDVAVPAILPLLGSSVATLKWIALSVVTPAYGFAGIYQGIKTDRRVTSWVVYVLLGVTLFSMINKPIQDIPACF